MASHGGIREGSGRPVGAVNKATSELKLNLSELAREYTNDALETLVEVMKSGQSDSARIAAATAILDRGYGRPTKITSLEVMEPFLPTKIQLVAYNAPV
jgi:endonuclease III